MNRKEKEWCILAYAKSKKKNVIARLCIHSIFIIGQVFLLRLDRVMMIIYFMKGIGYN